MENEGCMCYQEIIELAELTAKIWSVSDVSGLREGGINSGSLVRSVAER